MNLQIALILIGIAVVAGVYFYSRWESGRSGASNEYRPGARPGDGQGKDARSSRRAGLHAEPSFGSGPVNDSFGNDDGFREYELPERDEALTSVDGYSGDETFASVAEQEGKEPDNALDTDPDEHPVLVAPEMPDETELSVAAEPEPFTPESEQGLPTDVIDPFATERENTAGAMAEGAAVRLMDEPDSSNQDSMYGELDPDREIARKEAAKDIAETSLDPPVFESQPVNLELDESELDEPELDEPELDEPELEGSEPGESDLVDRERPTTEEVESEIPVLEVRVDEATREAAIDELEEALAPNHVAAAPDPEAAQVTTLETEVEDYAGPSDSDPDAGYSEVEDDPDADLLDERPSLKAFIGSMKPLDKIRGSIQDKLDAVKAERDGTAPPRPKPEPEEAEASRGRKWWKGKRGAEGQTDLLGDLDPEPTPRTERVDPSFSDSDESAVEDFNDAGILSTTDSGEPGPDDRELEDSRWIERDSGDSDYSEHEQPERVTEEPSRENVVPMTAAQSGDDTIAPADGFEKLSQIDYYVKLSGDRDVSRESVLAVYRDAAGSLSKRHSIYGLRLPDKVWRDLENEPEESRFGDLVITLQLADQEGPVTEHDMTRFSGLVMKLSETTGRGFAFMAPVESAHEQALAIERFRKRFDSIFVVNIRPLEGEMFEGPVVDRCATQIGLTADDNGFYARYKPVGKQRVCLYSLANMSDTGEFDMDNLKAVRTRGVTFFTRPAVNRSPGAVFAEMVDAAKAFASRIKGEVIAPGYDDLSTDDVEAIRRSIESVAKEMESYGINPGSEEATRLF